MPAIASELFLNYTAAAIRLSTSQVMTSLSGAIPTTTVTAKKQNNISSSSSSSIISTSNLSFSHLPESIDFPTLIPPSVGNLVVAGSSDVVILHEDLNSFHDATFDFFENDDDLFGSPLPFDASENGLWNGRFVPPPPRPPYFMDDPVLSDGLTTCDLCSWAMPTKSTFIFEGTIEKASELGWPLTLIIVSLLSAILGAIVMIIVVRCKRKKSSNNRNDTHVQWWSRNKRPSNNNHLRRSNIYTAHPADSIRGLNQPSTTLVAMGTITAATTTTAAITTTTTNSYRNHSQSHCHQHESQHEHQECSQPQSQDQLLLQQEQQESAVTASPVLATTGPVTTTTANHHDTCTWPIATTLVFPSR